MKIVVTAGHSNTDPGATYDGTKEADFCADMRNYVAYYLKNWGIPVKTDGEGRVNAPLTQAIALARQADIALEFHLNASTNYNAYGVEVLANKKDKELAQRIALAISQVTGSTLRGDNGYKPQDAGQHKRLGFVGAGGMIVELEFLSNKRFFKVLQDKRWVVAKAIAEEIKKHIEKGSK